MNKAEPPRPSAPRYRVLLVAGGMPGHDYDYVRFRLLRILGYRDDLHVDTQADFPGPEALSSIDLLLTYTCNQWPSPAFEAALPGFLEHGGAWLALHGSNSLLAGDGVGSPTRGTVYLDTLGTSFRDHPVIPYIVGPSDGRTHDGLIAGLGEFTTTDEFYIMDLRADVEVLLEGRIANTGKTEVLTLDVSREVLDRDATSAVLYRRRLGSGTVLYCSLGHCDRQNVKPRRCSWDLAIYEEILRRCIDWQLTELAQASSTS